MSLKCNVAEELKRSPVATISGAAGVVVAVLSLLLAWIQYRAGSSAHSFPGADVSSTTGGLNVGNLLLVVAYFLSVTITSAYLIRVVARQHDITAFFASIPLAALTNFTTILVIYLAPPRPLTKDLFTSAQDLALYASSAIFVTVCGKAVLRDIATTGRSKDSESSNEADQKGKDGLGVLFIALILLALWGWLVFAGQTRLARTLLPEITHPMEVKSPKAGT